MESIGNSKRDPRGWSITLLYFALIDFEKLRVNNEKEETQWLSLDEALLLDLAFDHALLIKKAINRLH